MGKPINWQPHLSQGAQGELKSATVAEPAEFRRAKITGATHDLLMALMMGFTWGS